MNLQAGQFLKSSKSLDGTDFSGATIYLVECNANGAVGFRVNRLFGRTLNELEEFKDCLDFPLYDGGPVDKEHLFFVHRRPDLIAEGTAVADSVFWSGNFKQAIAGIIAGSLSSKDIKIFIGYCGWDAGELEAEIKEGSWIVTSEPAEIIFS
jgi:putative transcriptional regulator